jgi:hypothetical protein
VHSLATADRAIAGSIRTADVAADVVDSCALTQAVIARDADRVIFVRPALFARVFVTRWNGLRDTPRSRIVFNRRLNDHARDLRPALLIAFSNEARA